MITTADRTRAFLHGLRNGARSWLRRHRVDPVVGSVRWGDFGATAPVSENFGWDRGLPVDRFYLERWLAGHVNDIRGRVLEVADDLYTTRFGGAAVERVELLFAPGFGEEAPPGAIQADLHKLEDVGDARYDCLLLTQTLQCCTDLPVAVHTLERVLAPGGVCLATFSGIAMVSAYDTARWGEYWRVTEQGAHWLFDPVFGAGAVEVTSYGNVASACAFLQGLCSEELSAEQLEAHDKRYPVIVCVRAAKGTARR